MVRKFFRSKLFISVILLVLAGILTFVFLPKMYGTQSEVMDVVQLINDAKLGQRITEDMLVTKTIGKYGVDKAVITQKSDIVGQFATKDIRHDTNLYTDMFTAEWEEIDGAMDTLLVEDDRLIAVSLSSLADSVGGTVRAGDVIDAVTVKKEVSYDEYSGTTEKETPMMLAEYKGLVVFKVVNSAGEDVSELNRQYISMVEANDGSEENFDSSLIPAVAILIAPPTMTDAQKAALVEQSRNDSVTLILHPNLDNGAPEADGEDAQTPATPVQGLPEGGKPTDTPAQGDAGAENTDNQANE